MDLSNSKKIRAFSLVLKLLSAAFLTVHETINTQVQMKKLCNNKLNFILYGYIPKNIQNFLSIMTVCSSDNEHTWSVENEYWQECFEVCHWLLLSNFTTDSLVSVDLPTLFNLTCVTLIICELNIFLGHGILNKAWFRGNCAYLTTSIT